MDGAHFRGAMIVVALGLMPTLLSSAEPSRSAPPPSSASLTNDELRARQAALFDKATKEQDEAHQRNAELMAREEKMMARQEEMMARQERAFDRFDKILATWERQQVQYQRYLDSLSKRSQ